MANSLSGLVGLTVGLPCSQVGTLFASVALVRIPNSYPGGFSETVRRNHPSIPLAAGAAFRRRGPSLGRRVSARKSLGHSPASGRSGTARSRDQTSLAPVGTRPVSENRQSAMSSLRANATIINPADPPAGSGSALVEPLAERAIRLIAQPAPRHLDKLCPDPCWTVAADPLVALRVSARPRGWRHTDPVREFATIAESAVEDLVRQDGCVVRTDRLQPGQRRSDR